MDFVDYRVGRFSGMLHIQPVRDDDYNPTHVDYGFEFSSSARLGRTELALLYHHVSRHLSDRVRPQPIF